MSYSRREFGRRALAGLPAAAVISRVEPLFGASAGRPNSIFGGVQVGVIAPCSFGRVTCPTPKAS